MTRLGILLFAHGARDPAWAQPFEAVARRLSERATAQGHAVTLAFLEFMSPDILAAGAALAAQGCTEVAVVPLFLGAGGHVRKDLPRLLGELADAHPSVQWRLSAAVGETDILIQGMADAAWSLAQPGT
ncbi:CbiX/SirB N-terminal domain-containing protein [Aquabacterium sp.]|jgi:sirohydrochlorin cobaltochelatase|uniref:sirohydrochlorin chelatase n=1 Tax=Aquabacterium sp. TaxID=1872578 RepID=UPI0024897132|nr:CbiX/SirB N-terminal domain-containing protein [Aquabacterium sp.]MDI1347819.1 CbiX/SirB N-terminal domain-containing protein [Aquabacterium sp.]